MTKTYSFERRFYDWAKSLPREEDPPKWRKEKSKKIHNPYIKCSYFRRG